MKKLLTVSALLVFVVILSACGREQAEDINSADNGVCLPGSGCDSGVDKFKGNQINDQMPNFELTKGDGTTVKLYDLIKGKEKVIFDLSADWCEDCKVQNEALDSYYSDLSDDIEVIIIYAEFNSSSGDSAKTTNQEQMQKFANEKSKTVKYPVFYDKDNKIQNYLGKITSTPKNYILNNNAIIKGISEEIDLKTYLA